MGTISLPKATRDMIQVGDLSTDQGQRQLLESLTRIIDIYEMMRKELDWAINGNLDVKNIRADRLHVNAANVDGQLTASQIDADDLHVNSANIDGTIEADTVKSSWVYAGQISASQIDVGTLTSFTIQTAVSGQRVVINSNGAYLYDSSDVARVKMPQSSNAAYGIPGTEYYDEAGNYKGVVAANSANDLFMVGYEDVKIFSQTGNVYINTLTGGDVYIKGVNVISSLNAKADATTVSGKADVSYVNSSFGYNLTFDPTSRNLKMFSATGSQIAIVNIP